VTSVILILELIAFYQDRKRFSIWNPGTRWRLPLACVSTFSLVSLGLDGAYEWKNWASDPDGCYVSSGFITLFFVFLKQSINLFLYDRAKIVHLALRLDDWRLIGLRWAIWLTIIFGIHAFFAWSYFLNFYGVVSSDGDCIYKTKYPEVIISFAASDAALNLGMLMLFFIPLYLQAMRAPNANKLEAAQTLQTLIRRNMILSLSLTSIDIISLSVMTFFFYNTEGVQDGSDEYKILWGNFAAVADQLVAVVLSHAMTGGWVPIQVRGLLKSKCRRRLCVKNNAVHEFDSLTTAQIS
jgi:hypothetical protein